MPFVTVTAGEPRVDAAVACADLAAAVAGSLGLSRDAVYVALISARTSDSFAVVDLRGRPRAASAMAAAAAAARDRVARLWNCAADDVWVQWHSEPT